MISAAYEWDIYDLRSLFSDLRWEVSLIVAMLYMIVNELEPYFDLQRDLVGGSNWRCGIVHHSVWWG